MILIPLFFMAKVLMLSKEPIITVGRLIRLALVDWMTSTTVVVDVVVAAAIDVVVVIVRDNFSTDRNPMHWK